MHVPSLPGRLRAALLAMTTAAALSCAFLASPTHASAADSTVSVDLSKPGAAATHVGSGFLYGLTQDGSGPADSLLQPLQPTLFRGGGARIDGGGWIGDGYAAGSGYRARINSALSQAKRVTAAPYGATYHLLVSDLYGADTTQPSNTVYPCDNGNCANWTAFIDQVVGDVQASGVKVSYDIWNEPDGTGFWQRGVNSAQYYQMWDTAVREIRRLVPSASIVGPSYSGYNHSWLDGFLGQTKADGTLPSVLNWHFGNDPAADAADADSLLAAHGLPAIPLTINEYLFSQQQNSAYSAWFLDRLAVSGVSAAAHAIWTDCCGAGTLDSLLTGSGSGQQPSGQWWVYQAYAQLTGNQVASTNSGAMAIAATEDQGRGRATALLGNNGGQTGTTTVAVNGLSSTPWLLSGGTVHVTVQRIPDQSQLVTPITVTDTVMTPSNGSISVPVNVLSGTDAYTVTLSPNGVAATPPPVPTTTVDANSTGAGIDQFSYSAGWGVATGIGDMYAGTANWTHTAGSTAQFQFQGSQVALHAVRDTDQGTMTVSVDGSAPVTLDDYAATRNASGIVWTSPVLANGAHTLTVTATGNHNPSSSGNTVALDSADVLQTQSTSTTVAVDGNATGSGNDQFSYSAGWGLANGIADMYDGTANWSQTTGSTATFDFTGTRIALHAVRDVDQEMIAVSVDGGAETVVDDYAATRNASGVVWTSPVLANGAHTLRVRVTGNHNPSSSGYNVAIDSVDVTTS
ncbi:hypothetical protein ACEZDB_33900 [Streptacidiphilus sp. N1-3]|uniref:Glycosyl hydrolase family 39 n=1 Tax=Streptacidiphilus alkalitolerans TaxID=3342712 RepID=A0ABV6XCJ3_9ACTN